MSLDRNLSIVGDVAQLQSAIAPEWSVRSVWDLNTVYLYNRVIELFKNIAKIYKYDGHIWYK